MSKAEKINKEKLEEIFSKIENKDETSIGTYIYGKTWIIIGKKGSRTKERVMRRYNKLKEKGICVYCGKRKATEGRLCKSCKEKAYKKRMEQKA